MSFERFTDRVRRCIGCGDEDVVKSGRQMRCRRCHRFGQMRRTAGSHGKTVPSYELLESLLALLDGMKCPLCKREMNWLSSEGEVSVVSLQHWRDGSFGLICRSCNARHDDMPDDEFARLPAGHKWCPKCKVIKPLADFCLGKNVLGCRSSCRDCTNRRRRMDPSGPCRAEVKDGRVKQVSILLSEGVQKKEIARRLGIGQSAVSNIISRNGLEVPYV